eukprot:s1_g1221.t1
MSLIEKFVEQRGVFETAYENGGWDELRSYFSQDMSYEVMNMSFHCHLNGIDAFIAGLKWSTDRFDKLCQRTVGLNAFVAEEGNTVLVHAGIRFSRPNVPTFETGLWEIATYRDGLIERMIDVYDPREAARFDDWMEKWGVGLDPRYVPID